MSESPKTCTIRYSFFHGKEEYDNGFEAEIIEQETFRIVRKAVEELPTQMRNIILYSMKGLKTMRLLTNCKSQKALSIR